LQFNADTGSNYSKLDLWHGYAHDRDSNSSVTVGSNYGYPTSTLGATTHILQIFNYSNTTTYKTQITRANSAGNGVDACVGLWRSTAAINAVSVATSTYGGSTAVQIGSTFTLYGIKAA
jgi:anti-sigma-K factor RskA